MAGEANAAFSEEEKLITLLENIPEGYKPCKDPFFTEGNKLLKPYVKLGVISYGDEDDYHERNQVLCNIPGCNKHFNCVYEYESHYNSLHRYLCTLCKKCLPTSHFLDLHIQEQHDSYFQVLAERKPMYACFIEECQQMSANATERKDHCIRVHKFPANFRFETAPTTSKPKKHTKNVQANQAEHNLEKGIAKNDNPKMMKNFSFGYQRQKAFDTKSYARTLESKQKTAHGMEVEPVSILEDNRVLEDLMDSLPC